MKEEHKHKHDVPPAADVKDEPKAAENTPQKEDKRTDRELREELKKAENEVKRLTGELENIRTEAHANKDRALRAMAEQNNAAKRQQKEKEEFIKYASGEIAGKLLPVLDDFENAVKGEAKVDANFIKGVKMIQGNLKEILEKEGLKKQEAVGKAFDPNLHEVVATEPTEDPKADGVVAEEFRPGYMFKDLVLRPAMVKVFKKTETTEAVEKIEKKEEGR